MFVCIWEFRVTAGSEGDFERIYAGADLYQDVVDRRRYLTMDRWRSRTALDALKCHRRDEYLMLDGRCSCLLDAERLIGEIES